MVPVGGEPERTAAPAQDGNRAVHAQIRGAPEAIVDEIHVGGRAEEATSEQGEHGESARRARSAMDDDVCHVSTSPRTLYRHTRSVILVRKLFSPSYDRQGKVTVVSSTLTCHSDSEARASVHPSTVSYLVVLVHIAKLGDKTEASFPQRT